MASLLDNDCVRRSADPATGQAIRDFVYVSGASGVLVGMR